MLFFLLLFWVEFTYSQIVIPNGGFEDWTTASCENLDNYSTSNAEVYYYRNLPFNVEKTTDKHGGNFAVSLKTVASATDTSFAYFINGQPDGNPMDWHGGIPYTEMPTSIKGYYKYNVATDDSATLFVAFSKNGVNIGSYFFPIGGLKTSYTSFDLPFVPALSVQPDSVIFGAVSCKFNPSVGEPKGPAGSILLLDDVSFGGVSAQPSLLDGGFELWSTQNFNSLDIWNLETDQGMGFSKSMDAIEGVYALELSTYLGSNDGTPVARCGNVSNGYYPDNCNGDCQQLGGMPFDNQIDTLAFSYKYAPSPNDTASVFMRFKKNGSEIPSMGNYLELVSNSSYQYVEMPFELMAEPDTVIIDIQSSKWNHQATSYVGSVLTIDNLHFKAKDVVTQLRSANEELKVTVAPNPSDGKFEITGLSSKTEYLEIINISGEVIYSKHNLKGETTVSIDLSAWSKGVYFVRLDGNKVLKTQKIVIK